MIRVGLTGGIGSGKSTVADLLVERGAVVVDGDQIARELVAPGSPALDAIVERFGRGVLHADGTLNRAGLADIVFPDPDALADLDSIMHPRIAARATELLDEAARSGVPAVVYDMPLLVETGQAAEFDVVVVVHAPVPVRLARLALRGIRVDDAHERMTRQASDEQRAEAADILIDNGGDQEQLAAQVDRAWHLILAAMSGGTPNGSED
jgi:dephospho-CoA kinase